MPLFMRFAGLAILAVSVALIHCGAYMDVDDAPRTALQAGAPPHVTQPDPTPEALPQGAVVWPVQTDIHPAVVNMPASAETSIDSVAKYLAAREKDPLMLVKALHDWVADRVSYAKPVAGDPANAGAMWWSSTSSMNDSPSASFVLLQNPLAPPSPERTFITRKGTCGDYASLFAALAKHTDNPDIDVRYVTGYARTFASNGEEYGYHAWNVAHVKGRAYMVDVTWDAGTGEGASFHREYRTDYLFTPPDIFAATHFPDWAEDQHTGHLLSREDFDAQPLVDPRFYELALALEKPPARAKKEVEIVVDNPYGVRLAAEVLPVSNGPLEPTYAAPRACEMREGPKSIADCKLGAPGEWTVMVFAKTGTTRIDEVAAIQVSSEG